MEKSKFDNEFDHNNHENGFFVELEEGIDGFLPFKMGSTFSWYLGFKDEHRKQLYYNFDGMSEDSLFTKMDVTNDWAIWACIDKKIPFALYLKKERRICRQTRGAHYFYHQAKLRWDGKPWGPNMCFLLPPIDELAMPYKDDGAEAIMLSVNREGKYCINKKILSLPDIQGELLKIYSENPQKVLFTLVPEAMYYGQFLQFMSAIKQVVENKRQAYGEAKFKLEDPYEWLKSSIEEADRHKYYEIVKAFPMWVDVAE